MCVSKMSSLETRSASALFKRAEQLKRWQESETCKEPGEAKRKGRKIQFTDGCVFLAACAATDKDEVQRLLIKGADIDTANVDGLTALHQACIDDNLEMVEFLVEHGADVNRGDNEGWTPLHATASCGFLSIAKYLLDHGANVSAVNNDGELAIDISESDEMEELLQKEIEAHGVDCEASRHSEERMMLEDARQWLNTKTFGDVPHPKTGATALHVAAAKGYLKVMNLLLQAGANVNCQDIDGWTPLHAASHWAQREAVDLLCEHDCDLELKNYVGQTAFDVADPDVLRQMEELKKKQASVQKDRAAAQAADIRHIIHRPPAVPSSIGPGTGKRRSSITRLSVDDKALRTKEVSSQERDLLLHKALVPETIPEKKDLVTTFLVTTPSEDKTRSDDFSRRDESGIRAPGYSPPTFEDKKVTIETENAEFEGQVHPWRRPASLRVRTTTTLDPATSGSGSGTSSSRLSPNKTEDDVTLRRVHSFESDEKFYLKLRELRNRIRATSTPMSDQELSNTDEEKSSQSNTNHQTWRSKVGKKDDDSASTDPPKASSQVRRSFVPPVRDEESETQRKAHAKRVRETRRSTQGVTLEDLKSAEQLVKRKQQQENQQRTSELQQLVASQKETLPPSPTVSTAATTSHTTTLPTINTNIHSYSQSSTNLNPSPSPGVSIVVTSSPSLSSTSSNASSVDNDNRPERRPSWRLRLDTSDKNKFRIEEERPRSGSGGGSSQDAASTARSRVGSSSPNTLSSPTASPVTEIKDGSPHQIVSRRKKPKRRSTGVVQLEVEEIDQDDDLIEEEEDTGNLDHESSSSRSVSGDKPTEKSQNGEIDYKKLWEETQLENIKLRDDLNKVRDDLKSTKKKLDVANAAPPPGSSLTEAEKKEKLALEKKLSEMEEELKQLEHLKNDNQRLRDENGALIRVISKLSK